MYGQIIETSILAPTPAVIRKHPDLVFLTLNQSLAWGQLLWGVFDVTCWVWKVQAQDFGVPGLFCTFWTPSTSEKILKCLKQH